MDVKKWRTGKFAPGIVDRALKEEPVFVEKNQVQVEIPESLPENIQEDSMWQEYSGRCIGCGRCNFVCPTCTCFTMQDIFYKDNPKAGNAAACGLPVRWMDILILREDIVSARVRETECVLRFYIRYQIIKKRFGYHMCVGCGRCENVCPEYISYIACLQKLKEKEGK